jgi:hypothetical protein
MEGTIAERRIEAVDYYNIKDVDRHGAAGL